MCIYMYNAKIIIEIARHFNFYRSLRLLLRFFVKFFQFLSFLYSSSSVGDITSLKRFEDVFLFVNFCVGIRISFEVL